MISNLIIPQSNETMLYDAFSLLPHNFQFEYNSFLEKVTSYAYMRSDHTFGLK
jgi:hypothetical protein